MTTAARLASLRASHARQSACGVISPNQVSRDKGKKRTRAEEKIPRDKKLNK